MRKTNLQAVNEMKRSLDKIKKLTLEGFIMPEEREERDFGGEEEMAQERHSETSGIEKELTQIRKIALSVINRLADQPTSPQYDTMKKIWNMVDKAIEQPSKPSNNFEQ